MERRRRRRCREASEGEKVEGQGACVVAPNSGPASAQSRSFRSSGAVRIAFSHLCASPSMPSPLVGNVVLGVAVVSTIGIIAYVHYTQEQDQLKMHQSVLKDK